MDPGLIDATDLDPTPLILKHLYYIIKNQRTTI